MFFIFSFWEILFHFGKDCDGKGKREGILPEKGMTKVTPATEKKHPNAFVAPVFLTNLWLKTRESKGGIPARKHAKKNYMSAIYVLIGFSLLVAIGFLVAFVWAVKNGQYEDDYTPSVRMLFDDAPQGKKQESREASSN